MNPNYVITSEYEQYFHSIVKPEINDNIIDAGAYIGDTAIEFCRNLKNKCKIFSFEPDDTNYKCLLCNITNKDLKNNIISLKAGLWRENTFLSFSTQTEKNVNSESYHISNDGNAKVKVISLDSFVKENKIVPSLIKMDIEGAEYEAIQGALNTIQTFKPKLQICIHHNVEDFWRIPILIKK
ncbi:FkbM family methyltransferase [Candidatus Atribacteria bacterium MT.SAG.1]|nr:FkbM family methyltransferase [Candidatus Atribacteria bacterium MT.SAG.1]